MILIHSYKYLANFDFWGGARDNRLKLDIDEIETIEQILEDIYPEGIKDTQLNDIFWWDFDTVLEWLGKMETEEGDIVDIDADEEFDVEIKESTIDYIDAINKAKEFQKSMEEKGLKARLEDVEINCDEFECPEELGTWSGITSAIAVVYNGKTRYTCAYWE